MNFNSTQTAPRPSGCGCDAWPIKSLACVLHGIKSEPFSFDTIKEFDQHIEQSIPDFGKLSEIILNLASYFLKSGSRVYDLGCSTGIMLSKLNHRYQSETFDMVGFDVSANLLGKYATPAPNLRFEQQDITAPEFQLEPCDMVLSIFTLQFLPLKERAALLEKVYGALRPGGALILAEKIYLTSGYLQDVFCFSHYDYKRESFTASEIVSKQHDLRRIMHPQGEQLNVAMLKTAGFRSVTPFWQALLFKAWVCVK